MNTADPQATAAERDRIVHLPEDDAFWQKSWNITIKGNVRKVPFRCSYSYPKNEFVYHT